MVNGHLCGHLWQKLKSQGDEGWLFINSSLPPLQWAFFCFSRILPWKKGRAISDPPSIPQTR